MNETLRTAWLLWLAAEPACCSECGAVKSGDALTVNIQTGHAVCDACLFEPPAEK